MQIIITVDKANGKCDTMLTEPMNPLEIADIFSALTNSAIQQVRVAGKPKILTPDKKIVKPVVKLK